MLMGYTREGGLKVKQQKGAQGVVRDRSLGSGVYVYYIGVDVAALQKPWWGKQNWLAKAEKTLFNRAATIRLSVLTTEMGLVLAGV